MYIYKKAGFENPDFFLYTKHLCFFFSYTLQQHFHWEIGFFTLCHFLLPHADTSLSVCVFSPQPQLPTAFSPIPWRRVHSGLSCMDEPLRSGRFSVFVPSQERSSEGLPSARWFLQEISVLAWADSAGCWEGWAKVGSGVAEEASDWVGCPESGSEAGGWCWLPGHQGL